VKKVISTGRLAAADTDVEAYVVDGHTHLGEVSHGLRSWYYWGPYYGLNALPELTRYVQADSLTQYKPVVNVERKESIVF